MGSPASPGGVSSRAGGEAGAGCLCGPGRGVGGMRGGRSQLSAADALGWSGVQGYLAHKKP
eukprot:CAMPEP_0180224854 /NCGR_PEP_ID=MMETSP0987-20121128/22338_1 /TAXON_ID=697907 /ORGANISM="non described non described, Strain CCMP2293" /LENGTH=60 /DNA_ID=CAMNT_0022187781 /DNA_START=37 /DNA_END=215 /DNA_ORIENTATION=-